MTASPPPLSGGVTEGFSIAAHVEMPPTSSSVVSLGSFVATDDMREKIETILRTGRISYGPYCGEFESRFALMHGSLFGVLSNSGTSSLQVAIQACKIYYGWKDGDEVIVPALTFVATVNAVLHNRLRPVLVDIEPTYYALDPSEIRHAITDRTRAIIPVHPFGHPADMEEICSMAHEYGLIVIEDSCESMFVKDHGKFVGSYGKIGCFSTYIAHLLVTGIGGIAITRDEEMSQLMRSLVNHGIDANQLPTGQRYDPSFLGRIFRFTEIGHSFRVTEFEGALGLSQLPGAWDMIANRRANAAVITEALRELEDVLTLPTVREGAEHAFMVYPLMLKQHPKQLMMTHLRNRRVECRDMIPLTNQPCYADGVEGYMEPIVEADYPVAQQVNRHGLYIPCHDKLDSIEIKYMTDSIKAFFRR